MSRNPVTPPLLEKKARLLLGQRRDLMHKSNPRVELWRAFEALVQARHAQEYEAGLPTVRDIADEFQSSVLESIGFINDQQLNEMRKTARDQKLALALMALVGGLHQVGKRGKQGQHFFFEARDRG